MKQGIHPQWYPEAKVTCACGATFTVGATAPEIHIEVCAACHPFFTGEARFVDTKGRVDKFQEAMAHRQDEYLSKKLRREMKKQQRIQEELGKPESLEELRKKK